MGPGAEDEKVDWAFMPEATADAGSLDRKFGRAIGDVGGLSSSARDDGRRGGEDCASKVGVNDDLRGEVCVGVPPRTVEGDRAAGDTGR